ncbi:MAG: N-acetyltransferase [bacterium]
MEYRICRERPEDIPTIRSVHETAFPTNAEANLVDALRNSGRLPLSLVGVVPAEKVVSHVALSPMTLQSADGRRVQEGIVGLGPVATLPEFRKRGYASLLIREALQLCREQGDILVFVLGNPAFYRRFGFEKASIGNIFWERPGFEDAFQIVELQVGALAKFSEGRSIARYAPEFDAL